MVGVNKTVDDLFREEVTRARQMSPEAKLMEGVRLFERACRVMADGIRHRHPGLDEDEVAQRVAAYLDRVRSLESRWANLGR